MVSFSSCNYSGEEYQGSPFQAGSEGGYVCIFDVVADGIMYNRALEKQEGQTLVKQSKLNVLLILIMYHILL